MSHHVQIQVQAEEAMFNDLREFINQVDQMGQSRMIEGADWNLGDWPHHRVGHQYS